MVIMTMALEDGSVLSAAISLALSGFSYGAVFVGGAILVNKMSLAAPDWHAVSKFYFIVYLFNATPLAAGWLADKMGVFSALLASVFLFMAIYAVFSVLALWLLLLKGMTCSELIPGVRGYCHKILPGNMKRKNHARRGFLSLMLGLRR